MTPVLAAAVKSIKIAAAGMHKQLSVISYQLSVVSAVLLSLAFSSFNFEFLAWFGFVPLFFALEGKNKLQSFLIAYLCGLLFFVVSMYWLIYVTPAGWILLSLYQALYFGIFGLAFSYVLEKSIDYRLSTIDYFVLPSAWVIFEYLRSHLMGGIGWNLLGYSQYKNLPIIQIADITGVWGISFLIMLMNVAVYSAIKMAIKCYKKNPKLKIKGDTTFKQELEINPVIQTLFVLILFIATLTYGYIVIASPDTKGVGTKQSRIKISVVQGNVQQMFKWDEKFKNDIMNRYNDLTIKALKDKPDLIIWPETAMPGFLNYDEELRRWIKELIKKVKIPLLAGAPMRSQEDKDYNSAILFSNKGKVLDQYDKLHLVAFGEFIPFEKQFPFLRKLFPITGNFISGKEYTVFNLRNTPREIRRISKTKFSEFQRNSGGQYAIRNANFSVLICFEDIFPGLVRNFVKRGADFMVNITNDAWFGKTCAAYQHAACSVLRAVENRRPFIHSANTGLSCFIDKTGRIYKKVSKNNNDLFIQGIKTAYVKIGKDRHLTFYTKYGDVFILGFVILFITGIVSRKTR